MSGVRVGVPRVSGEFLLTKLRAEGCRRVRLFVSYGYSEFLHRRQRHLIDELVIRATKSR